LRKREEQPALGTEQRTCKHEPQSAQRPVWLLFGAPKADATTWACKTPRSPIEKLITNELVLALTARTWGLQNCMSLIPKTKQTLASGPYDSM
jgi:hypothetical protein